MRQGEKMKLVALIIAFSGLLHGVACSDEVLDAALVSSEPYQYMAFNLFANECKNAKYSQSKNESPLSYSVKIATSHRSHGIKISTFPDGRANLNCIR
jgi:hydrogenase/urease accessory protein HupE